LVRFLYCQPLSTMLASKNGNKMQKSVALGIIISIGFIIINPTIIYSYSIKKGNVLIGGDIGLDYNISKKLNEIEFGKSEHIPLTKLIINPAIEYFAFNRISTGISMLYCYGHNFYSYQQIGPNAFITYYLGNKLNNDNNLFWLIGLNGYSLGNNKSGKRMVVDVEGYSSEIKYNDFSISTGVGFYSGVEYFLKNDISIYSKIGFIENWNIYSGFSNLIINSNHFQINIGINCLIKKDR
jgi:hypothetical protein